MNKIHLVVVIVIALMCTIASVSAQSAPSGSSFDVDSFSYRVSFRLKDGTEVFLIRTSFQITYLYRHHQPTISQHYFSGAVGFYFGRTALGRSLVREAVVQHVEFHPQWHDTLGNFHGPESTQSLFTFNDSIADGTVTGGYIQLDDNAVSRYLPDFGGILTIQGMTLLLEDKRTLVITDNIIEIKFEKKFNRLSPDDAMIVQSNGNITADASDGVLFVSIQADPPIIALVDSIASVIILSAIGVVVPMAILKRRELMMMHLLTRLKHLKTSQPETQQTS